MSRTSSPRIPSFSAMPVRLAYCLISILAVASSVHALTIYRIGGADLPRPELETAYDFVQLAWDDVAAQQHGRTELIELQPDRIAPQDLDPSVNLAPLVEELGGRIMILEWNGWQQWRDDDILIFDGDPDTAYLGDGHYLRVPGYGPQSKYWVFDFGGRFFIDRVRFYPRQRFASTRFIERFIIGISDGDPLKEGTREYQVGWRGKGSLDFDIVHSIRENTEPNMELALPTEAIQQLFVELPENNRGIWEIAEFEIYAAGPAARASYASNIIDLGSPAVLGELTWGGQLDAGGRIDLSMRTGDDDDPNTYWRRTFRGAERTRFDEGRQPLILRTYNRLQKGEQAGVTPDTEDWSFWSVPFDFSGGWAQAPSDRLRRYAQFRAEFHSTAVAGGHLDYLQLSTSIPLASHTLAEISPARASALTPTVFTFKLAPYLEADDRGFDRLAIDTPAQVQAVEGVRIGGAEIEVDLTRLDAEGFEVTLPRVDWQRTGELIEVDFKAEVFAYSTVFSGRIRDSTRPHEIAQPVTPGDADRLSEADDLKVDLIDLDRPLIGTLALHPPAFTPNGDGINDAVRIEYDLLYLVDEIAVDLQVYDLAGRKVGQPYQGRATSGRFTAEWNGRDQRDDLLPPGLYLLRLIAETDRGTEHRQRLVSLVY